MALLPWVVAAGKAIPELIEGTNGKFQTAGVSTFELTDDAGNKVGGLFGRKGATNLTIKDSNGKVRLFLGIFKGNPTLLFADKDGRQVARYAETNGLFETDH